MNRGSSVSGSALLCVGSGAAQRYRADTLRALALPSGAVIQFRYKEDLIPRELKARLISEDPGRVVVLGHVDCSTPEGDRLGACRIVPYRQAKLLACRAVGSFLVLHLELAAYRLADDLNALQGKLGGNGPRWEMRNANRDLTGLWCQELPSVLAATRETEDFKDREVIVKQLKAQPDFQRQPFFHFVEGIFERTGPEPAPAPLVAGEFQLRAGTVYELRVVHLDPERTRAENAVHAITVEVSSPPMVARTSCTFHVDSPYDVHSLVFTTGDAASTQHASLLLRHEPPSDPPAGAKAAEALVPPETAPSVPELYLPAAIGVNWLSTVGRIAALWTLLSLTQLAPLYQKPDVRIGLVAVVALLSLGTSAFVVLGLKKPL